MIIQLPDQLTGQNNQIYVTLRLSPDSILPTIDGQWERLEDGGVEAQYTRRQLREAVWAGLAFRIGDVIERLEHGEAMIAKSQAAGDQTRAEQLAEHYAALLQEIARLVDVQAKCRASLQDSERE